MKLDLVNTIAIAAGLATLAAVYYQLRRTPGSPLFKSSQTAAEKAYASQIPADFWV